MIKEKIGYSYNDLTIVPKTISKIESRSQIDVFYHEIPSVIGVEKKTLPIFTAPMASVISDLNYKVFKDNYIIPIIPRNILIKNRRKFFENQIDVWVALSLKEFEDLFIKNYPHHNQGCTYKVCVDIANGHMEKLYKLCVKAKEISIGISAGYNLQIMTGNIANPNTYKYICDNCIYKDNKGYLQQAIDYIRVGIGGGNGCITSSNTAIHYPQATLIDEIYDIKQRYKAKYVDRRYPYIIADGGIRNYSDVIKALGLGADYVMIGSLLAQSIESAGEKSNKNINQKISLKIPVNKYKDFEIDSKGNWWAYYTDEAIEHLSAPWKKEYDEAKEKYSKNDSEYKLAYIKYDEKIKSLKEKKHIGPIDVKFFGMASKDGQISIDGKKTKTAEGITKMLPVKFTIHGWVENMISYMRSSMSYCNVQDLYEFIGEQTFIVNSISEINAVNK